MRVFVTRISILSFGFLSHQTFPKRNRPKAGLILLSPSYRIILQRFLGRLHLIESRGMLDPGGDVDRSLIAVLGLLNTVRF